MYCRWFGVVRRELAACVTYSLPFPLPLPHFTLISYTFIYISFLPPPSFIPPPSFPALPFFLPSFSQLFFLLLPLPFGRVRTSDSLTSKPARNPKEDLTSLSCVLGDRVCASWPGMCSLRTACEAYRWLPLSQRDVVAASSLACPRRALRACEGRAAGGGRQGGWSW